VKWTTAKEVGDCLDLRIKNIPVLMMKFHLGGGGGGRGEEKKPPKIGKEKKILHIFFNFYNFKPTKKKKVAL